MDSDKFTAMLGFAKRARKIIYGYDSLSAAKGVKLLAVSSTASDNLLAGMQRLASKLGVVLISVERLEDDAGANTKALGITDINMAKEMKIYADGGSPRYAIISQERR